MKCIWTDENRLVIFIDNGALTRPFNITLFNHGGIGFVLLDLTRVPSLSGIKNERYYMNAVHLSNLAHRVDNCHDCRSVSRWPDLCTPLTCITFETKTLKKDMMKTITRYTDRNNMNFEDKLDRWNVQTYRKLTEKSPKSKWIDESMSCLLCTGRSFGPANV